MSTGGFSLFDQDSGHHEVPARARVRRPPRRKRRPVLWVVAVVVVALIGGGVWFGLRQVLGIGSYEDYPASAGEHDVVLEVADGDSTGSIAGHLKDLGVIASTRAFVKAAESASGVRSVQPGYYLMRTHVSGKDAVTKIVDPKSRVGHFEVRAGSQLDDLKAGDSVQQGIITKLHLASCAKLDGRDTCVSVEDLRKVAETGDLAALGAPDWAVAAASKAEAGRRLEGLIFPDVYNVKPGWTAQELWKSVITSSAVRLQSIGMPKLADATGFTPYQVLVMGSLIEREAITKDFGKVSRVTYNRLAKPMNLGYDSTINYVLDQPAIRTNGADRARPGAYNTYLNAGLTPTPIGSVSKEALTAAVNPEPGTWLFFVRCQKDGTSCFATTQAEHDKNRALAQQNGAY